MQDYELDAWLGPIVDDVTADQRAAILAAAAGIDARWPDEDLDDVREQALNAAAKVILGDTTLEKAGADYIRARAIEREAQAALTGAILATAATEPTTAEQSLAARAGVTRMTVRKALGK